MNPLPSMTEYQWVRWVNAGPVQAVTTTERRGVMSSPQDSFPEHASPLSILCSFFSSTNFPEPWKEWIFNRQLFSALGPACSLCSTCYPQCEEGFMTSIDYSITLWHQHKYLEGNFPRHITSIHLTLTPSFKATWICIRGHLNNTI